MNNELMLTATKAKLLLIELQMQGMIAENKQREILGQSMAYCESDFFYLGTQLEKTNDV